MNSLAANADISSTENKLNQPYKVGFVHQKATPESQTVHSITKPRLSDYWKNFRHSVEATVFGIDAFIELYPSFKNHKIGLVTNNTATTTEGKSSRKALLDKGFNLKRLFSPEHGLNAMGEDGSFQHHGIDEQTGLPIVSLYGERRIPSSEDLKDLDLVVFDLPDAGCRFYTFLWTMTHVMEACALHQKPLIVLDRPNPISGNLDMAEGPWLDESHCASFIGRWNIPLRHCLTIGELARYFASIHVPSLNLRVISLQNWNRNEMTYRPGWHFIAPSPALNSIPTAYLYPGMGLMEGINVSEGRGTPYPFHMVAAPWMQPLALKKYLDQQEQEGYIWQFNSMLPDAGPYAGQLMHGLQCHILDVEKFRPVKAAMELIRAMTVVFPDDCSERCYPTLANPKGLGHLDRLTGIKDSFKLISNPRITISTALNDDWKQRVSNFLLY